MSLELRVLPWCVALNCKDRLGVVTGYRLLDRTHCQYFRRAVRRSIPPTNPLPTGMGGKHLPLTARASSFRRYKVDPRVLARVCVCPLKLQASSFKSQKGTPKFERRSPQASEGHFKVRATIPQAPKEHSESRWSIPDPRWTALRHLTSKHLA